MCIRKDFLCVEQAREIVCGNQTLRRGIFATLFGAALTILLDVQNAHAQELPADKAFKIQIEEPNAQPLGLQSEDIYMSYDGLKATPLLNVGLADAKGAASRDETVIFVTYWNYNHWIDHAEIRIFDNADSVSAAPMESVEVNLEGGAQWTVPAVDNAETYIYTLRVYDAAGKFDETVPKLIRIVDTAQQNDEYPVATPIYGEDNTATRNIQINGGTATVSAQSIDPAAVSQLSVFGKPVLADEQGDFAVQQILPAGDHEFELSYLSSDGDRVTINRDIDIPENEFFFVGLGDLTIGHQGDGGRALVEAGGGDFDETFVLGRAAFYLKGKVRGKYLITASLDTTEDDISNIFSNLNDRNPKSLLRRLDPDKFYPIYGDDSTFVEDAPTQGRFYVRVEDGDNEIVWGNFLTNITSTEFSQIDRGLYGAKLELNSDATTSHGERRSRLTLFAADPGTIPGREEFRGTGGSVFFLENQDLTIGSERVRIEIRDKDTGLVIETRNLRPFVDYDIDYIQGRVVLAQALSSTLLSDQIVRDGNLSGDNTHLVVRYEFSPGLEDIGGFTTGGRAETWLSQNVRVGVTGQREETGSVDQTLLAGDVVVRATDTTYIKGEFAHTDGLGFNENASLDGGFTFSDLASTNANANANAYRVEGALGLQDISQGQGQLAGYYEDIEAGFSAPGRLAQADTQRYGIAGTLELSADGRSQIAIEYDELSIDGGLDETTLSGDVRLSIAERVIAGFGVRYNNIEGSAIGRNGSRTDIGAEIEYVASQDISAYVFGQGSVSENGTIGGGDRFGGGARVQINDTVQLNGEVSGGNGGLGALGGLAYQSQDGEEYYLNYTLDAERTDPGVNGTNSLINGQNTLTVGARRRLNSHLSVFGEERRSFGNVAGLTHAYGLDFNLADQWSFGATFETGEVENLTEIIDRDSYTISSGYTRENVNAGVAFEWRDDTINGEERESWFLRTNASVRLSPSFRALLRFDRAESSSSLGSFFDGEFTEVQVAGAYRPVTNDRFNALVRYTYIEDLAGSQQLSNSGASALPAQRSSVLSLDAQYRLTKWLTLGGKYGFRTGEVSLTRLANDFVDSTAQLGVLRADLHFIKKWDAVVEGRILDVDAADDRRSGILAALYRHVGNNVKIGVGYNFTDFSDDLTDQSFDDNGVFLNLIGKF